MACIRADIRKMNPKDKLVSILEDLDHSWYEWEIKKAIELYKSETGIREMAKVLRPYDLSLIHI